MSECFFIEIRPSGPQPHGGWNGEENHVQSMCWTVDPLKAVRFPRREDADAVILGRDVNAGAWKDVNPFVTGHEFIDAPATYAEAGDVKALVWIRKKLGLPEDAQMFSGSDTIAGKLHNLCFDAVRAELAEDRIKELEARAPAAIPEGLRAVLEKARVLIVNMDKWNTDVEKIVGRVPNTGFERAGDLVAEIDAALALGKP